MKVLIIQITDLHIKDGKDSHSINVQEMVKSLKLLGEVDDIAVVTSGDVAFCGKSQEYLSANGFLAALFKELKNQFNIGYVTHIVVPGNHDIDFNNVNRDFEEIEKAYKEKRIATMVNSDLKSMVDFFEFAAHYNCFSEDKMISKVTLKISDKAIGFVMVNTVPLSLLNGNNKDKGIHYLSNADLLKIDRLACDDLNVLVMHHSIEWMNQGVLDKLREIITKKYSLVLSGHEHINVNKNSSINDNQNVFFSQGYALNGKEQNGFSSFLVDFSANKMTPISYELLNNVYKEVRHNAMQLPNKVGGSFFINQNRLNDLTHDKDGEPYDDYYVFPDIEFEDHEQKEINSEIDGLESLCKLSANNKIIYIQGGKKTGKTALSNLLFRELSKKEMVPVLFVSSEINRKRINTVIEYMFNDLYLSNDETYMVFRQYDKNKKIAIIDEFEKINDKDAVELLNTLSESFGHIIVFSEKCVDIDVKRKAMDALTTDEKAISLAIKPFLYSKRKELISKVLDCLGKKDKKEIENINNLINAQIKFFDLSPEFIRNFIKQYEEQYRFQLSSGVNTFSVVFENSVKNRVIQNSKDIDPGLTLNILGNLAFFMHFSKKCEVTAQELCEVIDKYNQDYRQNVKELIFVDTMVKANLITENGNKYKFSDATIEAYFVARAINLKNSSEDVKDEILYMLNNMCFGINSDIILYLSLINNDARYISLIVEGARNHFRNQEQISFDTGNIEKLLQTSVSEKKQIPTKEEKKKRELEKNRQEENEIERVIQLVDEYDYTEEDLLKEENQILISFKYIEILCKLLPAFCFNMKVDQQDEIATLIYSCPNIFLYSVLHDINDNFDEFAEEIYKKTLDEKNNQSISIDRIKKLLSKLCIDLIWSVYNRVCSTCSTEQSIRTLNCFDYFGSSNYELMNLLMRCQCEDLSTFSKAAIELDKKSKNSLMKEFIRNIVWLYFLKNDFPIVGEAQALRDYFFEGNKIHKNLTVNMARNKYSEEKEN